MGYEDRDYYREESYRYGGGLSVNFSRDSMIFKLIVINVAVFAIDLFSPRLSQYDQLPHPPADTSLQVRLPDGNVSTVETLKKIKTDTNWFSDFLALKSDRPWYIWTYLTHGFAHASFASKMSIWHLAFNMATLFFLGVMVEQKLGSQEFLKFYLAAILVGGLGWLLFQIATGSRGSVVGASGAVSAAIIYFVLLSPQAELRLMGIIPIKAWAVGVLFLVMNILHAFSSETIAWESHLAGAAFGLAYFKAGWSFEKLAWPSLKRSRLKLHDPDAIDAKLQQEADRLLEKISEHGESSLSSRERKTLNKYSKSIRKRRS